MIAPFLQDRRIASQISNEERERQASLVIRNDGDVEDLLRQVDAHIDQAIATVSSL